MITLNGKSKLTTTAEKLLVELGGENPNKTLTQEQLAKALANATTALAEQGRIRTLEKIYLSYRREDPSLPSLEHLRSQAQREDDESSGR